MPESNSDFLSTSEHLKTLCEVSFLYLYLEPTSACNTKCKMCPRNTLSRSIHMMKWDVFCQIVRLLRKSSIPMVSIVGFGEPTLHPRISEMISYIKSECPSVFVKMTTNGSQLSFEYVNNLYKKCKLDLLEVSAVGCEKQEYSDWMGGLNFEHLLRLLDYLKKHDYRHFLTTFSVNGRTPETIRNYWTNLGVQDVVVKALHSRGGKIKAVLEGHSRNDGDYLIHQSNIEPFQLNRDTVCDKLRMFLHIDVFGNIVPCMQDINSQNILGNISQIDSFDQAKDILKTKKPTFDICHNCELKSQDLFQYYTQFSLRYFPEDCKYARR